jgi:sec-independent protein translocase protein TatB
VFDLSLTKLLVLAVIALVVFGPHELPKIASQAGRALRDLRRIAEGAKADLRDGLGPEFQDFEFEDLSPRRFVQKHLIDDMPNGAQPAVNGYSAAEAGLAGAAAPSAVGSTVLDTRATLLDGEDPPFDIEAT